MVKYSEAFKLAYNQTMVEPLPRVIGKPKYPNVAAHRNLILQKLTGVDMSCYPDSCGDIHGCSIEMFDDDEAEAYETLTELTYEPIEKPPRHPTDINENTPRHIADRLIADNEELNEAWARRSGALKAVREQLVAAYDEKWIKKLRHPLTAYNNVHPREIIQHLLSGPCKLTTDVEDDIRDNYYRGMDVDNEDITDFGKRLNEEQEELEQQTGIIIGENEKIHHYLKEVKGLDDVDDDDIEKYEEEVEVNGPWDMEQNQEWWENIGGKIERRKERGDKRGAKRSKFESAASVQLEKISAKMDAMVRSQEHSSLVQSEEVNAVGETTLEISKLLQQVQNELTKTKAELATVKSSLAKQNYNPNVPAKSPVKSPAKSALQDAKPAPDCSICGGNHTHKPNRRGKIVPESECSARDWPNHAGWWTPDYVVIKMNKKHGTNWVRPAKPVRDRSQRK